MYTTMEVKAQANEVRPAMARRARTHEQFLMAIFEYERAHGFPITVRELGLEMEIPSTSVVNYHLDRMCQRGLIFRRLKISRGITITPAGMALLNAKALPMLTAELKATWRMIAEADWGAAVKAANELVIAAQNFKHPEGWKPATIAKRKVTVRSTPAVLD